MEAGGHGLLKVRLAFACRLVISRDWHMFENASFCTHAAIVECSRSSPPRSHPATFLTEQCALLFYFSADFQVSRHMQGCAANSHFLRASMTDCLPVAKQVCTTNHTSYQHQHRQISAKGWKWGQHVTSRVQSPIFGTVKLVQNIATSEAVGTN
jgi:hypothetical protein